MTLRKKLAASVAALGLGSTMAAAEGLERVNIDPSFLFESGNYAEFGYGSVNPSIPSGVLDTVAGSFTVTNFAAKTGLGDKIDVGLWSTNNGNGASIDWTGIGNVKAELTLPTMAAMVRYRFNDNISVLGGLKRVKLDDGGYLRLPIAGAAIADGIWNMSGGTSTSGIFGVSYEDPSIAMRLAMWTEGKASLDIDSVRTENGGAGTAGTVKASIGDATTISFQTGIAQGTLLFGSVRISSWKNNQVFVPTTNAGSVAVSTFGDGSSYTLGLGRKFSDKLSGSVSYFSDPASGCGSTSPLAPTCENTSINLGAKYSLSDNAALNFGTTWTQYGDATTSLGSTTKSVKTSYGVKLSYKF